MKGRTNEEGIDPDGDKPVDDAGWRDELECSDGGKHGAPQERNRIEKILEPENLTQAWKRVRANKGAPGIDGMTVARNFRDRQFIARCNKFHLLKVFG